MKIILFLYFSLQVLISQNSIILDSIRVHGNDETDLDVITRELQFTVGEKTNLEAIEFGRQRIESLNIFNSVKYDIVERNGFKILNYHVVEKLNFFGKPILSFENNDNSKSSYGINFFHKNLRGRNEFISFTALFGYKPGYRVRYSNPWIFGKTHLKYGLQVESFSNQNSIELDKKQDDFSIGGSIGKGFGLFYAVTTGLSYNRSDFSEIKSQHVTDDFKESYLIYSLGHSYNSVDFAKFPKSGIKASQSFYYGQMLENDSYNYYGLQTEFSFYQEVLDNVIYANNFNSSHLAGNPRYYNQVFLGQNGLIRGNDNFNREFALNRTILRTELRYKFIDDYFLSISIPFFSKYTQEMRTSLYSYVFYDSGILYDDLKDITDPKLTRNGYGYGFSLLFPYVYRMSFEFGHNEAGTRKFVFLLNAFF